MGGEWQPSVGRESAKSASWAWLQPCITRFRHAKGKRARDLPVLLETAARGVGLREIRFQYEKGCRGSNGGPAGAGRK